MPIFHFLGSRAIRVLALVWCVVLLLTEGAPGCTCFCLKDDTGLVFGRNYDWHMDHGLVVVNKRNTAKRALLLDASDHPANWVSKYGSVTFNQYGREMPCGGMNEAGLVLETMALTETRHPQRDARPAVLSWLQYQLDNHATIAEVIASDKTVRITHVSPIPVHFLGCDRAGHMATFEFLNGQFVCHTKETLPVAALANDIYENSLTYLKQYSGFGGTKKIPYGSQGSLDRFVCAADRLAKYRSSGDHSIIAYAFDTLASVRQGNATKWTIVYDPRDTVIHYKTNTCDTTRTIRLADCDFDPRTPVQVISINTVHTGLLNSYFYHYDIDLNRWLVYYSMKHTAQLLFIPDRYIEALVQYPEAPALRYLTDWEAAGPFTQEGKRCEELFDMAFGPEQSGAETKWRRISTDLLATYPNYIDLAKAFKGGEQRAAYLRTQIESDRKKSVRLEIYSDDGVKAWLNGAPIHANNVLRGISSQPDTLKINLKKGSNTLLLKVTQSTGPWGAIVRLRPILPQD